MSGQSGSAPESRPSTLVEFLATTVGRHPDRTAVVAGDARLTYRQLSRRADAVAGSLRAAGAGVGARVGVLLPPSAAAVAAVLGVLRAGAAYVPLDPAYPAARLKYIADDAGLRWIVGDPAEASRCGLDGRVLLSAARDGGTADLEADAAHPVPGAPAADDPAYVIYTSGSTGHPKGCVVSHRNVTELLHATLPLFQLSADDRWTLLHSLSFDFSVWELWGAFATGGSLVVVPPDVVRAPDRLLPLLVDRRVTVLNLVPSLARHLVTAYHRAPARPRTLRYIVSAGEPVDLAAMRSLLRLSPPPGPELINMYGITETTVHATFARLRLEDLDGDIASPIGVGLPHLTVTLRDEDLEPVDDGVAGEIWISGAGVCTGYLDRPELTAARFRELEGTRSYRTGDLARRGPDGRLEYLGRNDDQLKVRGHRVEAVEVETALRADGAVRDAAVTVVRGVGGHDLLVALVVGTSGPVDGTALRRRLRERLPSHLVPNRLVPVEHLPLTTSGKVDRGAVRRSAAGVVLPGGTPSPDLA